MVGVKWQWAHCTHVVVNGVRAPGGWNSLSSCLCGLVSSIQKEKLFTPIIFLWVIQFRHTHIWHLRHI